MKRLVIIVVVIAALIGFYEFARHQRSGANSMHAGIVGSAAPNFAVQDLNGQALELANLHGKVVLLNFWATWCTPCRGEIPNFEQFQDSYGKDGLQIVGISMDDGPEPVREFYKQFKMNYPVAMGTEKLAQSYGGILGLPVTFLIGRDGHIAAKYVGAADIPTVEKEMRAQLQMH